MASFKDLIINATNQTVDKMKDELQKVFKIDNYEQNRRSYKCINKVTGICRKMPKLSYFLMSNKNIGLEISSVIEKRSKC